MGNPIQTIPNLPPAIAVSGAEQFWINQAGVDRRVSLAQALGSGTGGGGQGAPTISDYYTLRTSSYPPLVTTIVLNDPYKGGLFVRGPSTLPDNGGTRIKDASGQMWWRVYDERINAAWFYSAPPGLGGAITTLGSGPITITAADAAKNPQWVGLADDGGVGVQTAQPYPIGTYWDFVALQEWIYACAAEQSVPQSTFVGSMNNDGKVHITQWLTGPQSLGTGQPITGAGVAPGTFVTAATSDPNVYWVGASHATGGLNITTSAGTAFRGWVEGTILTSSGSAFTGPLLQQGDELLSPLYPPNTYFNGVLPGTVVGPQIDGPPGGGLGVLADFNIGIKQNVPSTTMTGVGGPTWNTVGGQYYRNVPGFCPRGNLYLNQMLVVNGDGLDLLFASKRGTTLLWYGTATGTSNVGPAVKFNTLAFSRVASLAVADQKGVSNYLVSLSHTPTAPGLNVENNTLSDWSISGNAATSNTAVAISPEGGTAQGDTQVFIQCWATGFNNGFTFGGANAIAGTFFGGQTQSCPQYGVAAFGGSFSTYTMLTENEAAASYYQTPQRRQIHLGGADFFANQVSTESCVCIGTRSEGTVGMIDYNHESSVMNWTTGGFFGGWGPNQHWTPQTLIGVNVPSVGSVNALDNYALVMMADDGGPPWIESDPTSTTTVLSFTPSPGWAVNQWANYGIWLLSGRTSASNVIASNTANTITLINPAAASGARWWKIFSSSAGAPPNWGATTHFGQFPRNAAGQAATIAQGFNLLQTAQPIVAGDWVMLPNQGVFPDGSGVTCALSGKVQNQHPGSTGWYVQAFGHTANIWGAPTNPILLGAYTVASFLVGQTSGTPGGVGQYTTAFTQNLGADFTGSIASNFLTVTAVANGTLSANQFLGGAGLPTSPAPQIANAGVGFQGFVDDGTGGVTKGTVLTVQAVPVGAIRPGTPLTGGIVAAGSVILSQISGTAGGVGTYNVSGAPQLTGQCAFTASMSALGVLNVSAITQGALVPGQLLQGTGVLAGTLLGTQISGATGGVGQYNINRPQNIASEAMTATWNLACGGQAAQFTATVDDGAGNFGNILTVTAMAGGVLGVGQTVNIPVVGGPAGLTQLATIGRGLADTGTGGTGTYTLTGIGNVLVPSSSMTANTTGGIGVYALSGASGLTVGSEELFSGVAGSTAPLWEIVDNQGNAVNAANYAVDGPGYWSAGIPDGGLTHMVIDFDVMYGVGALDQCQLGVFGKVGGIGRMDITTFAGGLQGQFIRPGDGPSGQFSYKSAAQFTSPPRFAAIVTTTPFTIAASFLVQSNVVCQVGATNTVLGLAPLGPGMAVDIDLWLAPTANVSGGMVVQWDTTTVRAVNPTINIGQGGQETIVRLKWFGNGNAAAPGGKWWVMSTQGPM